MVPVRHALHCRDIIVVDDSVPDLILEGEPRDAHVLLLALPDDALLQVTLDLIDRPCRGATRILAELPPGPALP